MGPSFPFSASPLPPTRCKPITVQEAHHVEYKEKHPIQDEVYYAGSDMQSCRMCNLSGRQVFNM